MKNIFYLSLFSVTLLKGQFSYPAEDFLKQLPMGGGTKTNFVLDFVADAFSDLTEYFQKAKDGGRIQQEGTVYAQIEAALALSNLDIEVDFIIKNIQEKKSSDPRITAISQSNFKFLIKYLDKKDAKLFWPCKKINLFYEITTKFIHTFIRY